MKRFLYLLIFIPCISHTQDTSGLLEIKKDSVNKKYDSILNSYLKGKKDYKTMPWLANTAWSIKEIILSNIIAQDYINNYLLKLNEDALYTKEHFEFIRQFNQSSKNKAFCLFYQHTEKIDMLMGHVGYATSYIDYIIAKENIDPYLWQKNKPVAEAPDWKHLRSIIIQKYNQNYAERTILNAQIRWYEYKKDSISLVRYTIEKIDKYGLDTSAFGKLALNNMAYYVIFMYSNDKVALNKAIQWMEIILQKEPAPGNAEFIDTYANLLYKTGRINEALAMEANAIKLDPTAKDINDNYTKMKKREPTWQQTGQ